jgi:hypothetical protein
MSLNEAWELFLGMCNTFNIDCTSLLVHREALVAMAFFEIG